ncbi:MAG TPA: Crp/Fnr family transcriptional regulator [Polyangiales bacterium]|nr:Crp/Fnr family transcriptional regulator [Polyangiales bacterium]
MCALIARSIELGGPFQTSTRPAGSVLSHHGSPIEYVQQVRAGRVKLCVADASGAERSYAMRGPGSFIGLEALLGMPAQLDALADVNTELAIAKVDAFERWLEEASVPPLMLAKHLIAEQVRVTAERVLSDGSSEARAARFALERKTNPYLSAWLAAPRHEVAGLLAMRPETLSRAMRTLQDRGVLGPDFEIRDSDALRRIAKESGASSGDS